MKAYATYSPESSPLVDALDSELSDALEGLPRHLWDRALGSIAREFLRRPGKRFRAELVAIAWTLGGGERETMPANLPHIVELLHAGSLIVDDIEDQAEIRRGAAALHKIFGVAQALNTGNWMYFWALNLIDSLPIAQSRREALRREACIAVERCHRGQALDLALNITELEREEVYATVRATTRLKTAALMQLAAVMGAIAAGASQEEIEALRSFGNQLGDGLQMLDDLGSLTSPKRAHKGAEDLLGDRPTWPWAWLAEEASTSEFYQHKEALARVVARQEPPAALAETLAARIGASGRQRVHFHLQHALASLESAFGRDSATTTIRREIARLEKSYE